ncbi:MAG: sigma-54-dependent Fis family transcriptional regulator [Myxococcales bacterium]|nr:sigma-54-dependent Fis family transcriptional regulator [Myxococcales bacterium]
MSLEAQLWREVGQHLELEESLRRILSVLREQFPVEALLIRRLDRNPARLDTVAVASEARAGDLRFPTRTELEPHQERALHRFLLGSEVARVSALDPTLGRALVQSELADDVVAAPLVSRDEPVGVALLWLSDEVAARALDVGRFALLCAPLTVAFENDQRLNELAQMREALVADRDALLSKLGRQDISEAVIGETGGLRQVMERVEQVAPTDAPVLILGETGSGKEVIARAIHARSRRAKGPVVRVNCGAIPPDLVDSELFGHEKGAFTGATGTRKGWFERADGGTLFLDEIGELPLAAQVRLLRVLQDGTLERVGGHQTIHVDVRIVAATHRDLERMVSEGTFRGDLWFRLSIFPIRLPALRERLEDIPALAAEFAAKAGRRLNGVSLVPSPADIELLQRYSWPGNVRELAAVIERAAILGNGRKLEVAAALGATALEPKGVEANTPPPRIAPPEPIRPGLGETIPTLDEAMAAHITRALEACHGRIEGPFGAAKLLDINPHTLRARMRKLGIEWSRYREAASR